MSAFAQGLQAGQRMAEGWIGAYDASRRRREEEELKRRREEIVSAQPEDLGLRYTPEQGEQLRMAAETGMYDIEPSDGGYRVSTREAEPQRGLVAPEQRMSRFMGQEYEGGLTPQRVQQLRDQAMLDTVTDPIERQRLEASQLQLSEARSAVTTREATRAAQQQVAARLAAGEIIDVPTLFQIASESGADTNELMQTAGRAYEITTKQADTVTRKLVGDIRNANTPQKFNELLKQFDPNPEDNIVPELRIAPDGTHQVFYGDQPFSPPFRGNRDMSAMAQLASHYTDQVSGNPMATAVQLATLDANRAKAEVDRARVQSLLREGARADQQLLNTQTVMIRGADGRMQQAITGMRFNRSTGTMEAVTLPLDSVGVPMSALDPRRVQEIAETLVNKPVDPTNTGRKAPRHTEASARQAAVDMIVNSYLGGDSVAAPDVGIDVQRIREMDSQGQGTTQPTARATAPRPAPLPDPARRDTAVNPVTGLARETPATAPNLVEAAGRALSAGEQRYLNYLQAKIDRNEPLTPDEQIRARRFGL